MSSSTEFSSTSPSEGRLAVVEGREVRLVPMPAKKIETRMELNGECRT